MQQDNNHQFDNFVRKVLSEKPSIPEGFEWENMDIEIPKKKKRFPFFYPLLIASVVVFSFLAGYIIKGFMTSDNPDQIAESHNPELVVGTIERENETTSTESHFKHSDLANNETVTSSQSITNNESVNNNKSSVSGTSEDFTIVKNGSQITSNDPKVSTDNYIATKLYKSPVEQVNQPEYSYQTTENRDININTTNSPLKNTSLNRPSLRRLPTDIKDESNNTQATDLRTPIQLTKLANDNLIVYQTLVSRIKLIIPPTINQNDKPQIGLPKNEIALLVGTNINHLRFSEGNVLNGKIENVLGRSFGIKYQRKLNTHFLWNATVQYDEYHTVFNHNREVSRVDNYTSGIRTITREQVYQNNFSNTLSLSSGLSLKKPLSSNIALQGNLAIGATYLISQSGKTLIIDDVSDLADVDLDQGVNINIQPSLDLRYNINDRFGLQLSYVNRYSLDNSIHVNQDVQSSSMHQVLTGLAIKF